MSPAEMGTGSEHESPERGQESPHGSVALGLPCAAIFDMDGVLVDTYRAHFESWREMARGAGLDMTEARPRKNWLRRLPAA